MLRPGSEPTTSLIQAKPAVAASPCSLLRVILKHWIVSSDSVCRSEAGGLSENSELLYGRRFTANQFVLAQSPFRTKTKEFFQLNPYGISPYVTSSLTRWACLYSMLGLSSSVCIAEIACYWKFFLLHYIQVLCQYRFFRANHAYLMYLML
jgi:hypothetical protein